MDSFPGPVRFWPSKEVIQQMKDLFDDIKFNPLNSTMI